MISSFSYLELQEFGIYVRRQAHNFTEIQVGLIVTGRKTMPFSLNISLVNHQLLYCNSTYELILDAKLLLRNANY
jgi:hypothetical protein